MCGRFNLRITPREIQEFFDLLRVPPLEPRFNIAPTQEIVAVRRDGTGQRDAALFKWGLIPSWQPEPTGGARMINARAETVATKPAFRSAFRRRRCVIPASGFYEWEKISPKDKQPWHIQRRDGTPLLFGGLWERWDKEGAVIESCSIITTTANRLMSKVHDRMPVILDRESIDAWLDRENEAAGEMLQPCPEDWLTMEPVSKAVNNVRNQGEQCLNPQ